MGLSEVVEAQDDLPILALFSDPSILLTGIIFLSGIGYHVFVFDEAILRLVNLDTSTPVVALIIFISVAEVVTDFHFS